MVNCGYCGIKLRFGQEQIYDSPTNSFLCWECSKKFSNMDPTKRLEEFKRKKEEELKKAIEKAPKIKCPFCEQWFPKLTAEQYRDSAELNVLKWAIVPAWGLSGSLKNKPYIECPHCKMKIMQG